jgi:putative nucleotidyltransferase with HDIG domain
VSFLTFPRRPPRLVVRTLVTTSAAIGLVLIAVFVVLSMDARNRAVGTATENLDAAQRVFAEFEEHRQQERLIKLNVLAENRSLASAVAQYRRSSGASGALQRELDHLAALLAVDALILASPDGKIIASAGQRRAAWPVHQPIRSNDQPGLSDPIDEVIARPSARFRVSAVDLSALNDAVGGIYLAIAIDDGFAAQMSTLLRVPVSVIVGGEVIGSTLTSAERSALLRQAVNLPREGTLELADEPHSVRRLNEGGPITVYAMESLARSTHRETRSAIQSLSYVAIGAMALGTLASLWLARALANPIDQLSQQLRQIASARDFSRKVQKTGSSRELDTFTDTFNQMVATLQGAEAQTELAYVGAIKALAAALDARDTYTAGHSERVSSLSVLIGRQLHLEQSQLDILRLGALLHDIGKIGIADRVLQKNGPLSRDEFEIIKAHPTLGAHILRQVPFLTAHIPIVELHHERPDGRGYPHGLLGHATPLLARIVHVADAFDAMTTARAYRPAQTPSHAIAELWRYAGSQFDTEVVEAFVAAWSAMPVPEGQSLPSAPSANVLPFERSDAGRTSA